MEQVFRLLAGFVLVYVEKGGGFRRLSRRGAVTGLHGYDQTTKRDGFADADLKGLCATGNLVQTLKFGRLAGLRRSYADWTKEHCRQGGSQSEFRRQPCNPRIFEFSSYYSVRMNNS